MTRIAFLATIFFLSSTAVAQDKPAAKEAAKPAAAKPVATAAAAEGRKSRRNEDARHCLEKSSNTDIIKCAEAYL